MRMIFRSAQKNIFSPHILTEKSVFGWKSWLKEAGKTSVSRPFSLNGDGCCQIPNDTITSGCRLWLSRVSGLRTACFSGVQKVGGGWND